MSFTIPLYHQILRFWGISNGPDGQAMRLSDGGPLLGILPGVRVAGIVCQQWGPIESTLQVTTEFLSDRAFLAQQDRERFVVYFEFFTTWHSNGRWDMLAKSGILSQREKLPTRCIPVILQEEGFPAQFGEFRLEVGGSPTQQLWFHPVCLWQKQPEDWWEDSPGLMALFPLCRHGRQPREAVEYTAA